MADAPQRTGNRVQNMARVVGIAHVHPPRHRARAWAIERGDRPSRETIEAVIGQRRLSASDVFRLREQVRRRDGCARDQIAPHAAPIDRAVRESPEPHAP